MTTASSAASLYSMVVKNRHMFDDERYDEIVEKLRNVKATDYDFARSDVYRDMTYVVNSLTYRPNLTGFVTPEEAEELSVWKQVAEYAISDIIATENYVHNIETLDDLKRICAREYPDFSGLCGYFDTPVVDCRFRECARSDPFYGEIEEEDGVDLADDEYELVQKMHGKLSAAGGSVDRIDNVFVRTLTEGESSPFVYHRFYSRVIRDLMFDNGWTGQSPQINSVLRCEKGEDGSFPGPYVDLTLSALSMLLFPSRLSQDLVVYRGDGMGSSSSTMTTRGLTSTSVTLRTIKQFTRRRILRITIPAGTKFMPVILKRMDEGEILLYPGTVLERTSYRDILDDEGEARGLVCDYVVKNVPEMSDRAKATIFRRHVALLWDTLFRNGRPQIRARKQGLVFPEPPPTKPDSREREMEILVDLLNTEFGCDW